MNLFIGTPKKNPESIVQRFSMLSCPCTSEKIPPNNSFTPHIIMTLVKHKGNYGLNTRSSRIENNISCIPRDVSQQKYPLKIFTVRKFFHIYCQIHLKSDQSFSSLWEYGFTFTISIFPYLLCSTGTPIMEPCHIRNVLDMHRVNF